MHSQPPPKVAIDNWLKASPRTNGNYGHLLLEQKVAGDAGLVDALLPYFESAHADARQYFHAQIGISLHPDADEIGHYAVYPNCLPISARRGLFGEVLAGLVTESYVDEFVGGHPWQIPVFLFRHHADVEAYLYDFARDEDRERQVFGRFGSDFIGLAFDEAGSVIRFIAGEAKWRKSLQPSVVETLMLGEWLKADATGLKERSNRGIWFEVNRSTTIPHGLRQMQRLLEESDPGTYANAILSLDNVLMVRNQQPLARTNLILIAGDDVPSRTAGHTLLPWQNIPTDYIARHDLQVVELIITNGHDFLIDAIYDRIYNGVAT